MNAADNLHSKGVDQHFRGKYQRAIEYFTNAIELKNNYFQAYNNRGASKDSLGDHQGAIADYDKAIELKSDDHYSYNNRGNSKKKLGYYKQAIEDYDEAIRLKKDYSPAYFNRGNSKSHLGDYAGAIEDYNQVIQLKKEDHTVYYNRGNSKQSLGDHDGAIKDYDKAIQLKSDYKAAYFNRGNSRNSLRDYEGALADFDKAIAHKSDDAYAYNNRGSCKMKMKDYQGAILDFLKAFQFKPDHPLVLFNLAKAYNKQGKTEQAVNYYKLGQSEFSSLTDQILHSKYSIPHEKICYIKARLNQQKSLQEQFDGLQKAAKQKNRADIIKQVKEFKQQLVEEAIEIINPENTDLTKSKMQSQKQQLQNIFRAYIKKIENRLQILQSKNTELQSKNTELQNRLSKVQKIYQQLQRLKPYIKQMIIGMQGTDKLNRSISSLQNKQLEEYYQILYTTIINHLIAYRIASTRFFTEEVVQVSTFDKIVSKIAYLQPVFEFIPILGNLVGAPFKILDKFRKIKNSDLVQNIAQKINRSPLKSNDTARKIITQTISQLTTDQAFKHNLQKVLSYSLSSTIAQITHFGGAVKQQISQTLMGGTDTKNQLSHIQQLVALHVAYFTVTLYQCQENDFVQKCENGQKFYEFLYGSINSGLHKDLLAYKQCMSEIKQIQKAQKPCCLHC